MKATLENDLSASKIPVAAYNGILADLKKHLAIKKGRSAALKIYLATLKVHLAGSKRVIS